MRLADVFADATVEGTPSDAAQMARTEWVWNAEAGAGTRRLEGAGRRRRPARRRRRVAWPDRDAGAPPRSRLAPPPEVADDKIHSIELRLKTSGGGRASFGTSTQEQIFLPPLLAPNPFAFVFTSPIVAGEETKLYTLRPITPIPVAGVRHLLLRPVDAPGAEFAIESVRVVFEREHLASIPGRAVLARIKGIFRETLVARSPETLRFDRDPAGRPLSRARRRHAVAGPRHLRGRGRRRSGRPRGPYVTP